MSYWEERFKQLEKATHSYGQKVFREIEDVFRDAEIKIQKEIEAWYGRFAKNNDMTMLEAKKLLNTKEFEEFKWDVNKYIEIGRENALNQKWMKELENASSRFHVNRLEALKVRVQQIGEVAFQNQLDIVDDMANKVFKDNYYHTIFEVQKGFNVGFNVGEIDERRIKNIIYKPWTNDGENFSERIWKNKNKLINEVHKELSQTILLGESPNRAIKNIVKKMNTNRVNASRLVMTELAYFHTISQQEAFKELDAEEYEILAVLDSKTSPICQDFDGQVFKLKDMKVGVNAPPFHPNCRSIIIPYYDDFGVGERIAKDKDGKTHYVPADMKYKDWKEKFVDNNVDDEIDNNNWRGLNYNNPYDKKSAIMRLKDRYGIEFKDSKKYPMDGELLSDCVAWLDSFDNQYPGFMEANPCKIPMIYNAPPARMVNSVGLYRYYLDYPEVEGLYLNSKFHSDVKSFNDYIKRAVEEKWYPQNSTTHRTFVHEFGHHVSHAMKWITGDRYWERNFIKECLDEFKKVETNYTYNTYKFMQDYVSRYSTKSESEFFAETFTEYFGGENPREFAKIFGRKLESLLKGLK